uniref:Serine/threonine-protein kinase RIO1 n=2 Tax=Lotharella globosa TaxID=91324 RepID=A0A7S3ZDD4_9EUKA|mmetsp:Transcript_5423/g.9782  ORF Transcript_5423/g.9782 Transcript_5423/m.9782 type:complete len:481 (+) Transcript_5423:88-1530(+)
MVGMSKAVSNALKMQDKKLLKDSIRHKGREDRATSEQVLDPRTRLIIFKMLNRGVIDEIHGCISTGKEANVYHCDSAQGDRALKVFKTSILVFKDRDRYVTGEYRFRHGYCKSNPRKMVKVWAEKEMRNLKRLHAAGIPCPEPIQLRMHVLLMSFIGKGGWPAPRLKDAKISTKRYRECYYQCIEHMRTMYQVCKLVHADLSEYNILYLNKKLYIIDVSQSVEHDHPNATAFLKKDIENVNIFFKAKGVGVMSLRQLYDFITTDELGPGGVEGYLERVRKEIELAILNENEGKKADGEQKAKQEIEDQVFMQTELPRSLHGIEDIERHIDAIQSMKHGSFTLFEENLRKLAIHTPSAAKDEGDGARKVEAGDDEESKSKAVDATEERKEDVDDQASRDGGGAGGEDEEGEGEWEGESTEVNSSDSKSRNTRFGVVGKLMSKEERRAHKKSIKDANRERRKKKMKKKDKRRHIKKTTTKSK